MIAQNLETVINSLPEHVQLVAVSKTKPYTAIQEAYNSGHRDFGENKAQEIVEKYSKLPKDVRWHFIGHLQTNKVVQVIDKVFLIHSLDSLRLFQELEKQAKKLNKKIRVLIQFHIAEEETKHGFNWLEALDFFDSETFKYAKFVEIVGIMGMATFTSDTKQIKKEFDTLKSYFDQLKSTYFYDSEDFKIVSMGMSGDYKMAIECGSTMIRVGSSIFGER
jgi:pyridoxal phosphate enzyme (YggS family)